MILLDTNVLIYAFQERSPFSKWARDIIASAVAGDGAAVNAVTLAEFCVGDAVPSGVADRIRAWGVEILDLPAATEESCSKAYRKYRARSKSQSGKSPPSMPLPDFFIGAHAKILGWEIATADPDRFATYFPSVSLRTPR